MSLETIKRVSEAERVAASAASEGAAKAAALIREAEGAGEALLTRTYEECRAAAQTQLAQAEGRAADAAREIAAQSEKDCAALREAAGKHLAEAQAFIIGKVVER